jgi:DNA-binding transcriptional MerR regulator
LPPLWREEARPVDTQPIPQKLYYRIGEVADIAGVKPHVLRYWESEFGLLSPRKNEGNQRFYTQKDLQKILMIKQLLYEERFTIAGARRKLREEWRKAQQKAAPDRPPAAPREDRRQLLGQVRRELQALVQLLQ